MARELFITDGGLETTLIFHDGIDLRAFAAFDLLSGDAGTELLRTYFERYLAIAREHGTGFVLDTATWRANPDWGAQLGYSRGELDAANRRSVALAKELRDAHAGAAGPIVVNGVVGPRGDGYVAGELMSADEAERYHREQIATFGDAGVDRISAITLTYPDEAIGIARAANAAGVPVAVSFTLETDGRLPDGTELRDAIERVDADTGASAAYFMVNCAHPTHFEHVFDEDGAWTDRVHGLRANASTMSHAELDAAEELDDGDPADLAARYRALRSRLRNLDVLGGCCGTDHRHVAAICRAAAGP